MIIRALNNLDKDSLYTQLSNGETVGGTALRVNNINAAQASWAVQIGRTGNEKSEIKLLTSSTPSGTSLFTTGTLNYNHASDTPVYFIKYDKIIFKRSTSGTTGSATALTNGTVTITPDSEFTQFDDTSGASNYAYRIQFFNSVTSDLSSESDWITPSGYSFYSLATIRQRVRDGFASEIGASFLSNDTTLNNLTNEWFETMNNGAIAVNQDYSIGTVDISFGTNGLGTITSSDFKEPRRIWVTYNGSDYSQATKMDLTDDYPGRTYSSVNPYFSFMGDNVMQLYPSSNPGTARVLYYKNFTPLVNDGDELPISMRSYTSSFVNYVQGNLLISDGKDNPGERKINHAKESYGLFISQITPRGKTGPTYMKITDAIDGEDFYVDYL